MCMGTHRKETCSNLTWNKQDYKSGSSITSSKLLCIITHQHKDRVKLANPTRCLCSAERYNRTRPVNHNTDFFLHNTVQMNLRAILLNAAIHSELFSLLCCRLSDVHLLSNVTWLRSCFSSAAGPSCSQPGKCIHLCHKGRLRDCQALRHCYQL